MPQATLSNLADDLSQLTVEGLDRAIAELDASLRPYLVRLSRMKKIRAAKLAAVASAQSRAAKISATAVIRRREEIGGGRGHITILAKEFDCSARTIHRKLTEG